MLSCGVVLFQDNAWPHTAVLTKELITSFGWGKIEHFSTYQPTFNALSLSLIAANEAVLCLSVLTTMIMSKELNNFTVGIIL